MYQLWLFLKSSFTDLLKNKIRTGLTSLGILIGVFSVVLLMAFGQGLKNYLLQEFERIGKDLIFIFPGNVLESGPAQPGGGMAGGAEFDERDYKALQKVSHLKYLVPVFIKRATVEGAGNSKKTDLYMTTSQIFQIRNLQPSVGRVFTDGDEQKHAKVAVIGPKLAVSLFNNDQNALGKTIRAADQRFTVIGVLESIGGGSLGGQDYDSYVYLPRSAGSAFNPDNIIFSFYVQPESEEYIDTVKNQLTGILLKRYDKDDFTVGDQQQFLDLAGTILRVMNAVLLTIGSISLLVGGIGIMNIMYASVTERITEIGIRRALGATHSDILLLFLSEAVLLSLIGGLVGLFLATLIVLAIQPWFPASVNLLSIAAALGVSSGIGVFFGVFPAIRAAKRSPIDAIRYE